MLRRGRVAALAEAGPAIRDRRLGTIARTQFWLADNEEALETLRNVSDPKEIKFASHELALSTFNKADYAEQRRIAGRLGHPEARAAILAQTIERHLQGDAQRRALDPAVERLRADSIAVPQHRSRALTAVAFAWIRRGDTAAANETWRAALAATDIDAWRADFAPMEAYGEVPPLLPALSGLVSTMDTAAVRAWIVGQPTAERRAWAHAAYGSSLRLRVDVLNKRGFMFNNGPDACIHEF
jgi:hypothetical protein